MAEPARLLDEEAVRRALAEELAPRRVDAVLERARAMEGAARPTERRRLTDAEIIAKARDTLRRKGTI